MNRILLNYASGDKFKQSQIHNSQSGLAAGFNVIYQMSDRNIDRSFKSENEGILSQRRGVGYWLWKPYFIDRLIWTMNEHDVLFYADAGSYFVRRMEPVFDAVQKDQNGVLAFNMSGGHTEKYWTKRDVFRTIGAETSEYTDTPQRMASFMVFRGTAFAKALVREYLNLCCNSHLITDEANVDGWVEPKFQDNRHDQSIWSVLTKKHQVATLPDPTQWGLHHKETTEADVYINHTRDPR
jgi:hypothetical protein